MEEIYENCIKWKRSEIYKNDVENVWCIIKAFYVIILQNWIAFNLKENLNTIVRRIPWLYHFLREYYLSTQNFDIDKTYKILLLLLFLQKGIHRGLPNVSWMKKYIRKLCLSSSWNFLCTMITTFATRSKVQVKKRNDKVIYKNLIEYLYVSNKVIKFNILLGLFLRYSGFIFIF